MFQPLEQKDRPVKARVLPNGVVPLRLEWRNGQAQIIFSDGGEAVGCCIRCPDVPCIEYRSGELKISAFEDFPADLDSGVCPTNAITWKATDSSPSVEADLCISCGLCASRCPVGAIGMNEKSTAFVNDESNQYFVETDTLVTPTIAEETKTLFRSAQTSGRLLLENDGLLARIYSQIDSLLKTTPKLSQHLTRNLLLALGNECAMRRLGDVNVRIELVFAKSGSRGIAEVEVGLGVLEAPRNILDNIAVLAARYQLPVPTIVSLIVGLWLPNQRTDYWHVLKDIKKVLGVRIRVITIGALMILVWEQKRVSFDMKAPFYADDDSRSIRKALESALGRPLMISPGHLGLAEPGK